MEFDIDAVGILAPDLPALVGAEAGFLAGNAVFPQPRGERMNIGDLKAKVRDAGRAGLR